MFSISLFLVLRGSVLQAGETNQRDNTADVTQARKIGGSEPLLEYFELAPLLVFMSSLAL